LVDGDERRFDATRIKRLAKRGDSFKNGAYIGGAIGAVLGLLFATSEGCTDRDVELGRQQRRSSGSATAIGSVGP
jgi:gas vesicle protein